MINIGIIPGFNVETSTYEIPKSYINAITLYNDVNIIILSSIEQASQIDGLLLIGGGDVHPLLYNEDISKSTDIDILRDKLELALINECIEKNKSVLGICKGIQIINIACGGTLHQDISNLTNVNHSYNFNKSESVHSVNINEDSLLYSIFDERKIFVNSRHHQAINKLGRGLKSVAVSNNDIIEAVEYARRKFVLGIQWHPEDIGHQNIFKKFIESMKKET